MGNDGVVYVPPEERSRISDIRIVPLEAFGEYRMGRE